MARELGFNPKKLGGKANHKQDPWKAPLPEFIEDLYFRRFGKKSPDRVQSIEDRFREQQEKKFARHAAREESKPEKPA